MQQENLTVGIDDSSHPIEPLWGRLASSGVGYADGKRAYRLPFHFRGPSLNSWNTAGPISCSESSHGRG